MSEAGGAIRSIKIVWELVDRMTAPANKINAEINKMLGKGGEVATKYQETTTASTDKITKGYQNVLNSVTNYVNTAKTRITALSETLEKHKAALLGVGTAAGGIATLSAWGAMNEEKYRANVRSLFGDEDNELLQAWISQAENQEYTSKEGRGKFVSQMSLYGATADTILKYGESIEKLGITTGHTLDETLTAFSSAAGGQYRSLKYLGITDVDADAVASFTAEVKKQYPAWSETQIQMEALMRASHNSISRMMGDYEEAIDSTYASSEIMKNQWSDLSGDVGAVYLPTLRSVFNALTAIFKTIESSPILTHAFAWGTLLTVTLAFGGLALPKVIAGLKWWKSLTILQTLANWGLVSSEAAATGGIRGLIMGISAYIPAAVTAAYAEGGLTAALWAGAAASWAFLAPWLPIIAAVSLAIGAIWLLWDVFDQGWENSALKGGIDWLLETFPWLTPLVDGITVAFTYLQDALATVWDYLQPIIDSITGALENPYVKLILDAMWAATPMGMIENVGAIATGKEPKLVSDIKDISGYSEKAYRQEIVNKAYANANRGTTVNHITVDASMNTGDLKTEGVTKEDLNSIMDQRDKKVQSGMERMMKGELTSVGATL